MIEKLPFEFTFDFDLLSKKNNGKANYRILKRLTSVYGYQYKLQKKHIIFLIFWIWLDASSEMYEEEFNDYLNSTITKKSNKEYWQLFK